MPCGKEAYVVPLAAHGAAEREAGVSLESEMENLPSTKKVTTEVAKLTTGIAGAIAGIFFPGASVLGPIANYAIDKYIKRPEEILIKELKSGNLEVLTDEKAAAFIPMAYKFFEAAKEGEYEHNLRMLAELLKNEMQTDAPDVSSFARMSRRIEGLTHNELKVIALINASLSAIIKLSTDDVPAQTNRPFVSAHSLANDPSNREKFDHFMLQETLSDLAGRGLLIVDGATRLDKYEEYYFASSSFMELIEKAKNALSEAASKNE
jgi:hypothetical protein